MVNKIDFRILAGALVVMVLVSCKTSEEKNYLDPDFVASDFPVRKHVTAEKAAMDALGTIAKGLAPQYGITDPPAVLFDPGNGTGWLENLCLELHSWISYANAEAMRPTDLNFAVSLRSSVGQIFRDPILRDAAYAWAMPSVKIAFKKLAPKVRNAQYESLIDAKHYLDSFDEAKESNYLSKLSDQEMLSMFLSSDPGSNDFNPHRALHAFLYRRVAFDNWSRKELSAVIEQAITDLKPLV